MPRRKEAHSSANGRPDRQRLRLRRSAGRGCDALDNRQRHAPEQHVDGIAGRVRLMQRRIEVAQAERKVDRIDVFQGWRQKRKMRREIEDGDDYGNRAASVGGWWVLGGGV